MSTTLSRDARLARLVDLITTEGEITVEHIMDRFGVSGPTARRDLDALAAQQLVTRTRGGARPHTAGGEVPLRYRAARNPDAKAAIARTVAGMVAPGSVIAFNGGTTTTAAAYEVGVRTASDAAFADVQTTVVTNAVNIANDLAVRRRLRLVVLGGVARASSYELVGPLTSLILPAITIDTLFLGVGAVDTERGLFTVDEAEAAVNAALVTAAARTVVVADTSKLCTRSFARICGLDDVDALVTDAALTPDDAQALREAGVEPVIAE